ncbi:hypothetical protein MKW94_011862 [Papaver nudicaule]|uniref:ATP synthase CF0 subunit I n=1 Tax=Papaver nudicaule TaxID=74823 RepID=A0AA41RVU2_PAPNU|nr:hypothetical protein [Papaver nudicaule]
MKNITDSFIYLGHCPSARSFGFNTDILAINLINLINLSVVLGVLIFFGKGVCADNRKQRILSIIRDSEELRGGAIEQLEKARTGLRKVEMEVDQTKMINSTYKNSVQLENYKNQTIPFEQQKTINQVR